MSSGSFALCHPCRNQAGQILLMTAFTLPILLGFTALAVDAGFALEARKQIQNAADAAALAGAFAYEHDNGIGSSELSDIVESSVLQNGYSSVTMQSGGTCPTAPSTTTVCVYHTTSNEPKPTYGFTYDYSGDSTAVGVVIVKPTPTFFIGALSSAFNSLTVRGKAVANRGEDNITNGILFGTTNPTDALFAQGNGNIEIHGALYVNSSDSEAAATQSGSAAISATHGVFVVGGVKPGSNISPVVTGVAARPDPLETQPIPTVSGAGDCTGATCTPGNYTWPAILHPDNKDLASGVYVVSGAPPNTASVIFEGNVNGTGVTIYIADGHMEATHNSTVVHLAAPTDPTDPNYGIVIFQRRDNIDDTDFTANAHLSFEGAVYMKGAKLFFDSGAETGSWAAYTLFLVDGLRLQGGGLIRGGDGFGGSGSPLRHISLAE